MHNDFSREGVIKIILAIGGEDKTGKTTVALTFPEPIKVFEFDIATVERAIWRFPKKDITVSQYPTPIGWGPIKSRDIKSVWDRFIDDYGAILEDKGVPSLVIDTSSKCWWIGHTAYLQELQKKSPRERLLPIEYGEPNNRMASLIYGARTYNKNLVLVHHLGDVYQTILTEKGMQEMATGEKRLDGFKYTESLVDLVMYMKLDEESKKPVGTITLSGLALEMVGLSIAEPSYDKIVDMAKKWRGG